MTQQPEPGDFAHVSYFLEYIGQERLYRLLDGYRQILGRNPTRDEGFALIAHFGAAVELLVWLHLADQGRVWIGLDEAGKLILAFPDEAQTVPLKKPDDVRAFALVDEVLTEWRTHPDPDVWGDLLDFREK